MGSPSGSELGRANLDVFAETLLTLAQDNRNVLVVTSDSRGSGRLTSFAAALPDQLVEVGSAEQSLVGVAAGLASTGKTVYAVSPASFLTARSLEQIKNDVSHAVQAAGDMEEGGVSVRVISMHTIRPLDTEAVIRAARECRAIVTVEEHSCADGLGKACAAVPMQAGLHVPFRIVGLPDEDTVTGDQLEIFTHYGISAQGLAHTAKALRNR